MLEAALFSIFKSNQAKGLICLHMHISVKYLSHKKKKIAYLWCYSDCLLMYALLLMCCRAAGERETLGGLSVNELHCSVGSLMSLCLCVCLVVPLLCSACSGFFFLCVCVCCTPRSLDSKKRTSVTKCARRKRTRSCCCGRNISVV